jgi:hypothetical protein
VSEKGFAEGWHNGIDFECLIGTENLSEKDIFLDNRRYDWILHAFCINPKRRREA